eukprot:6437705-Prymnesium_polylepis.1
MDDRAAAAEGEREVTRQAREVSAVGFVGEEKQRLRRGRVGERARRVLDDAVDRVVAHPERVAAPQVDGDVAVSVEVVRALDARDEGVHRRRQLPREGALAKVGRRVAGRPRRRARAIIAEQRGRQVKRLPAGVLEVADNVPDERRARVRQRRRPLELRRQLARRHGSQQQPVGLCAARRTCAHVSLFQRAASVSYTHLRAHETLMNL